MSSPIADVERELLVRSIWPNEPSREVVAQLVRALESTDVRAGSEIYKVGEPAEAMYLIPDGEIELRADGLSPWKFDGASFVGILDVIIGRPYSRTAVALEDIECERLPAEEYWDILEDDIVFTQDMLIVTAETLEERRRAVPVPGDTFSPPSDWRFMRNEARDLGPIERVIVASRAAPFESASADALVGVTKPMEALHLRKGDLLFAEGAPVKRAYVVARGAIELSHDGGDDTATRGPGDAVNVGAAFARQKRLYTARAATDATVLGVDLEVLFDRMEEHFGLLRSALSFVALEHERINLLEADGAKDKAEPTRAPEARMTGDFDLAMLRSTSA